MRVCQLVNLLKPKMHIVVCSSPHGPTYLQLLRACLTLGAHAKQAVDSRTGAGSGHARFWSSMEESRVRGGPYSQTFVAPLLHPLARGGQGK